jgi:hypothetical protein
MSSAAQRNRDPILSILRDLLAEAKLVLEIASGAGDHAVHFARHMPALHWQPSDPSPEARTLIRSLIAAERLANVLPPLELDATADAWPIDRADALVCINMVHISPWATTEGLMRGAARLLGAGQPLYLYGPYRRPGRALEPSNAAFDADLKRRDPRWGLRELDAVVACADTNELALERVVEMPANNLSVIFRRR